MLYVLTLLALLVVLSGLKRVWHTRDHSDEVAFNNNLWRRDPLSHPAIQHMSGREVADLPFDPREIASE